MLYKKAVIIREKIKLLDKKAVLTRKKNNSLLDKKAVLTREKIKNNLLEKEPFLIVINIIVFYI